MEPHFKGKSVYLGKFGQKIENFKKIQEKCEEGEIVGWYLANEIPMFWVVSRIDKDGYPKTFYNVSVDEMIREKYFLRK